MSTFTYDHIHIRSRDPEKTAAYYERMFDAQIIRTMQEGATRIDMKKGGLAGVEDRTLRVLLRPKETQRIATV